MSSNLPPGVTEDMLPGNRPEDDWWEQTWDRVMAEVGEQGNNAYRNITSGITQITDPGDIITSVAYLLRKLQAIEYDS